MRFFIKLFIFSALFIITVANAQGEFYQYKDEDGNLRFTDDISVVPEGQREGVKTHESVASPPGGNSGATAPMPSYQRSHSGGQAGNGTWEDRVHSLSRELDQMREQLNKTAESLRNEQIKIEAEAPGENASRSERSAYAERVNALNEKIERYNHQRRVFDEKVQAFNRQIKGDQE